MWGEKNRDSFELDGCCFSISHYKATKNVHLHLSISPDDAISGPVNGQSVRPSQVSSDDDPAIFAVHVSTPNVRLLPPVSPEQVADSKIVIDENTLYDGH